MRIKIRWLFAAVMMILMAHAQGAAPDEWEVAHEKAMNETIQNVRRIDPLSFSPLLVPDWIVNKLKEQGCKIPQAASIHEPHNIINGEFGISGQTDWAALCSRETGSSFILVLWGDKSPCPSEILTSRDSDKNWIRFPVMNETSAPTFHQRDKKTEGYLRVIRKVSEKYFSNKAQGTATRNGDKFTNEGIVESASIDSVDTNSYYCMNGNWNKWSEDEGD
jgi:hypothetical protein